MSNQPNDRVIVIVAPSIRSIKILQMASMIKLATPLVIGTLLVVTILSIVRLVFLPDSWASSLAALVFLPLAIGLLLLRSRSVSGPDRPNMIPGRLRAGLVGAGVLLAASMLLSITDELGVTGQGGDGSSRSMLIVMLPALLAVVADILSARLERKVEKDPD